MAKPDGLAATHAFAATERLHAMALTETWTHGNDLNLTASHLRHIRGIERATPAGAHRGGRLTLGMNALVDDANGWTWQHLNTLDTAHTQWLRATTTEPDAEGRQTHIHIASVYMPNANNTNARALVWQHVERTCERLRDGFKLDTDLNAIVIGGDLNGRLAMNGDTTANAAGAEIRDFAERNEMVIANAHATARGDCSFTANAARSTVDYALVDAAHDDAITALQIHDNSGIGSDHKPLVLELTFSCTTATHGPPPRGILRRTGTARPQRQAMRPDNHDLNAVIDATLETWLNTAQPSRCAEGEAVNQLVRSFTSALQTCADATKTTHTRPPRTAPDAGSGRPPRLNRPFRASAAQQVQRLKAAIAHAAASLKAARTAKQTNPIAVAVKRAQLKRLHTAYQRATRREQRRQNQRNEQVMFRTGGDAEAWHKLQNALALSRRRRARASGRGIGAVAGPNGEIVTDPIRIAELFRQHFAHESAATNNADTPDDKALLQRTAARATVTTNLRAPTNDGEVQRHISQMKSGKAPGPDGTYPELLKMGNATLTRALTAVVNAVLRTGVWPADWSAGHVVPLPKAGGDRQNVADHRGISLLPVISKLTESILNDRLVQWLEATNGLHDAQHGFRPGRSTLDAAFILHEVVSATKEAATASRRPAHARAAANAPPPPAPHHTVYIAYLDVRKAYDGCWRAGIIAQLRARGIDAATCALFESMLAAGKVTRTVSVAGVHSDEFVADSGVPQGAVLSPALYNTFIDGIARALEADPRALGATAHGIRIPALLYADDIALIAHSAAQLQQMLDVCAQYAAQWHFSFNAKKCAVQIEGRNAAAERTRCAAQPFTIADATNGARSAVEIVDAFKYLGLKPDFTAQPTHNARWALQMAAHSNSAYRTHHQVLAAARRIRWLSPATLMRLHTTYCAPKAEYGAQIWAPFLTTDQRKALNRIQTALQMRALLPSANAATAVPHCFAAGEFARAPPATHCDELALRYLQRLTHAPANTVLRRLFDARMAAARARIAPDGAVRAAHDSGAQSWCTAMRSLCARYGLTAAWDGTAPPAPDTAAWHNACRTATRDEWTRRWRAETTTHVRLNGLHSANVRVLRPRPYLFVSSTTREGRELHALARSNALPLGAERADLLRRARDAARARVAAATDAAGRVVQARARVARHVAAVCDDEIAAAAACDECCVAGAIDTRHHFFAECNPQRFAALTRIVADALHRVGHVISPATRVHCTCATAAVAARPVHAPGSSPDGVHMRHSSLPPSAQPPVPAPHTAHAHAHVSDRCDGQVMADNFRNATATDQIAACLNGGAKWILRGTALDRGSQPTVKSIARALVRCTQNFLLLRWRERCRKIGATPVVAFAPNGFGRQLMTLTADGAGYRLLHPRLRHSSAAAACAAAASNPPPLFRVTPSILQVYTQIVRPTFLDSCSQ